MSDIECNALFCFLLYTVVAQGTTVFKLFASEDESLLVWWNAFLVLDLGLHIVDGVAWFNLQGDGPR